ncbi:MAG: NUDIX hydrolase [Frankiaceae bacterium]|nr:NUDIX hydrolase [Frankiaceae bacterium]
MSDGGLPAQFLERARAAQDPAFVAARPRDAATVALVRDGRRGMEVYLLRRVSVMSFAGGMHVFPGGSVDPADAAAEIGWAGPPAVAWGAQFATSDELARSLVCAAVRETFEESGVLFAGPSDRELLADVSTDEWEAERVALEGREHSLSELLARRGLVLRSDLLRPLAHWITPEVEPKRFDTRFFLARLPAGQVTRTAGTEADQRLWLRPADALEQELTMLPPTRTVLTELAAYDDVDAALNGERDITPVLPKLLVGDDDRLVFLLPGDDGYPS